MGVPGEETDDIGDADVPLALPNQPRASSHASPTFMLCPSTDSGIPRMPMASRQATRIYESRSAVRERIAKSSPNLQHSEKWLETLLSVRQYRPPGIWWLVNLLTSIVTIADLWFSDGPGFDAEVGGDAGGEYWSIPAYAHNILLGLLSLLLAFRTSQAYERWWEARKLWGQVTTAQTGRIARARCSDSSPCSSAPHASVDVLLYDPRCTIQPQR